MSHTYVILDLSSAVFAEIARKLEAAGYCAVCVMGELF